MRKSPRQTWASSWARTALRSASSQVCQSSGRRMRGLRQPIVAAVDSSAELRSSTGRTQDISARRISSSVEQVRVGDGPAPRPDPPHRPEARQEPRHADRHGGQEERARPIPSSSSRTSSPGAPPHPTSGRACRYRPSKTRRVDRPIAARSDLTAATGEVPGGSLDSRGVAASRLAIVSTHRDVEPLRSATPGPIAATGRAPGARRRP